MSEFIKYTRGAYWISVFFLGGGLGLLCVVHVEPIAKNEVPGIEARRTADSPDCGAVALYILCRLNHKPYSLDFLRGATKTTAQGATLFDLKVAATAVAFDAEPCNISFENLCDFLTAADGTSRYAILHFGNNHFAAAMPGSESGRVRVIDRSSGIRDVDGRYLRQVLRWSGTSLLLTSRDQRN